MEYDFNFGFLAMSLKHPKAMILVFFSSRDLLKQD